MSNITLHWVKGATGSQFLHTNLLKCGRCIVSRGGICLTVTPPQESSPIPTKSALPMYLHAALLLLYHWYLPLEHFPLFLKKFLRRLPVNKNRWHAAMFSLLHSTATTYFNLFVNEDKVGFHVSFFYSTC